jgi:hypothetical protein
LYFLAQATHKAAKRLAAALQLDATPLSHFDAYPCLYTYRHAVELYLKDIVLNEGGNFLGNGKPDHISVAKTRSLSWLAQFVVQIVTALQWEERFRCEGIEDIVAFKEIIEEVNRIDTASPLFRLPGDPRRQNAVAVELRALLRRLDALLDMLNSTADTLAAEWDRRSGGIDIKLEWPDEEGFTTTIQ